ncbi:MAG: Ferrous-iron efflux pump FieF [Syntrophorhabdaceae bacterium PtaU1.Bin034]|nr:MAG: Ferrous-iron efflux pump FieF [Syntrophorhabdaceae bacterium PtaU1.Bin034]
MDVKQKASGFAVLSAFALAVSKFTVGLMSGSMAVVSSGLDSLLDVFMSAMNFFAIRKAAQPADEGHPYGHAKAESIAGAIQAVVIIFTGGLIIYQAVQEFLYNHGILYSVLDMGVMGLSLTFSLVISLVLKTVGRRTGSNALKADALHYASDLYSNSAAILAIFLTYYTGKSFFDITFAICTGLIIMFSATKILREGISGLMDSRIPKHLEDEIESILGEMSFPYAGYHKLRTRFSGNEKYVDFHLLTCRELKVDEAHELAHRVEDRIKARISTIDVVIHLEPCTYECQLTEMTCFLIRTRGKRPR